MVTANVSVPDCHFQTYLANPKPVCLASPFPSWRNHNKGAWLQSPSPPASWWTRCLPEWPYMACSFSPGSWVWQITKVYHFLSLDLHLVTPYLTQSNMVKGDITGKMWSCGLNPSSLAWWATHTIMLPCLSFTAKHTLQGWGTTNLLICVDSDLGIDTVATNSFSPAFQEYLLPLFPVWVSISSYLEGPW